MRLLFFLPELLMPFLLFEEIVIPLWRSKSMFPLVRGLFRVTLFLLAKPTGAVHRSLSSSEERLRQAKIRREAALKDAEAAKLEREAEDAETRANLLREGSDR